MTSIRGTLRGMIPALIFLLAWAAPLQAEGNATYDLGAAVLRALEANPKMTAARAGHDAAESGRKSARGAFLPSLSTTYGYTRYDHDYPKKSAPTREQDYFAWTFNVHQDLFTGFNLLSTYQKAKLTKEKAAASVDSAELSLILNVQTNYLELLKARETARSAQDSVARLESQLKVTQAFYDVGLKPRLDVLQAEVDLATAKDSLLQAQNGVDTQIARLNTLLALPLNAPAEYMGKLGYLPFSLALDTCLERAYRNRPDMIIAAKSVEIADKNAAIARSSFFPQIGADFDWSKTGDHPNVDGSPLNPTEYSSWTASVSASMELFNWGETYYSLKQQKDTLRQVQAEADDLRQEVSYEVKARYLKISEAAERIKVARKALEAGKEGYRMAVARYQAQVGTNTDVLDAQARLSYAEASMTQALADYQTSLANLYVAIGEKNTALLTQ